MSEKKSGLEVALEICQQIDLAKKSWVVPGDGTIYFGSECTFWTDREDLAHPCHDGQLHCPYCHCSLNMTPELLYMSGLGNYLNNFPKDKEWPSMWLWAKDQKCFDNIGTMREAYRVAVKRKN
jgi:hypothetical protein